MSADHITLPRSVVERAIEAMEKARAHFCFSRLGECRLEDSVRRGELAGGAATLRVALDAPQAEPPGYKLVPVEPLTPPPDRPWQPRKLGYTEGWNACRAAMLPAAPDLRPNTPEAATAPAEKPADHQLEHLVTREDVERLAREAWATLYRNRHVHGTAFAFGPESLQRFANLIAAHVAQKLKGGAA